MPFAVYSLQRLGLFVASLLALWALHLGSWLLVVLAAFLAWALSYLLLAGSRDRAALWVAERVEGRRTGQRFSAGVESDALDEDAAADEQTTASRGSDGQAEPEEHAVAELERPGPGEHRPEEQAPRTGEDGRHEEPDGQGEEQHQQ